MYFNKKATKKDLGVITLLNALLADVFVLYTKTLNFHWNVEGPNFDSLHNSFKAGYEQLQADVDTLAEQIRANQGRPFASMKEFLDHSDLDEVPGGKTLSADEMLRYLVDDLESLQEKIADAAELLEDDFDSPEIAHILLDMETRYSKTAWMYRSSIGKR